MTDNFSQTLQKSDISGAQGQEIAGLTIKTFNSEDKNRWELWFILEDYHKKGYYTLRLDLPTSPYAYYKAVYYEVLDLIINCTKMDLISLGTQCIDIFKIPWKQLVKRTTSQSMNLFANFMFLIYWKHNCNPLVYCFQESACQHLEIAEEGPVIH